MQVFELLKDKNYMIGIPSRQRTFLIDKKGGVWRYIKDHKVCLTIREEEANAYQRSLGDRYPHLHIRPVPNDATICYKRQGLLDEAIARGVEYLFIIDDDVTFYFRDENLSSKYTSRAEDFDRMQAFDRILLESIYFCNDEYPINGLPLKQGSFGLKYMFPLNIPIIRYVCYHVPTLVKHNIRVDGLGTIFMSDRYVQLSLLEAGFRSLSNCRWCIGDYGTGYKGGCSITRTVELQEEAARALVARFPKTVSLKVKENGLWDERRLDCVIRWRDYFDIDELRYIESDQGLEHLNGHEGYHV